MFLLEGKNLRYAIDAQGRCASCQNRLTGHEYIREPGALWKIIYAIRGTERAEVPIWADDQSFTAEARENELILSYDGLLGAEGMKIDASLQLIFQMSDEGLRVTQKLTNRDPRVTLMELQATPVSGVQSLDGDPENDYIAWPMDMGLRVRNPAFRDISTYMGFRKYERHDQFHTDMDGLYQDGNNCTMQWFDWYNEREGLYCGSEDLTRQALSLHAERDVKSNVLRLGFIRYPMIEAGESWQGQAMAFFPHIGDWHAGAKMYRAFMDRTGSFTPPVRPAWCQDFTGWLRCIFKQHHGELNWDYSQIPALYDELSAAGLDTLFLLGWEKGGFARMWPDYEVDDRMGGEDALRKGIEYVHSKGGHVLMFLSYALIDHQSNFYRLEGGQVLRAYGVNLYLCGHDHGFATVERDGLRQITVGQPQAYPGWAGVIEREGGRFAWHTEGIYGAMSDTFLALRAGAEALGRGMARGTLSTTAYAGDEGAVAWFTEAFLLFAGGEMTPEDCARLLSDENCLKWRQAETRTVVKEWILNLLENCPEDMRKITIPLSQKKSP